ncbi:MAG: hypothetical protein K0S76_1136 [Herbinix sp.]|jgi:hypothetical protein|nr:hypothetical protein [Herbinix sp.]
MDQNLKLKVKKVLSSIINSEAKNLATSDPGCQNRWNKTCKAGVHYVYEGEERWHCGCCSSAFWLHPAVTDIPQYIKLVELGGKK